MSWYSEAHQKFSKDSNCFNDLLILFLCTKCLNEFLRLWQLFQMKNNTYIVLSSKLSLIYSNTWAMITYVCLHTYIFYIWFNGLAVIVVILYCLNIILLSKTNQLTFELSIYSIYHSHIISIYSKLDIIYHILNLYYYQ